MLFFYVFTRPQLRTPIIAYLIFTHYLFLLLSVLGHRRWYFVLTWSVHYDLINYITNPYPCRRHSVPPCTVFLPKTEVKIGTRHLIPITHYGCWLVGERCSDHFVFTPEKNHTHLVICIVHLFIIVPWSTYDLRRQVPKFLRQATLMK